MLPPKINKKIGQAMADFGMLTDGDHVLLAVSGGVDSLVLAWVLYNWQKKAPIDYVLYPVHIDMGIWEQSMGGENPAHLIQQEMKKIGLSLSVERSLPLQEEERTCYTCSKLRRKQLFDLASRLKCNKVAFGHHKDDLIETLFLNMFYSGNISTMVPSQSLFDGGLTLIRPLAYVEKTEVMQVAEQAGLSPVTNVCPLAGDTRREEVQKIANTIYERIPGAKSSIFAAMANVRKGYML